MVAAGRDRPDTGRMNLAVERLDIGVLALEIEAVRQMHIAQVRDPAQLIRVDAERQVKVRIRLDALRISRGPCRAPGRLVTPRSVGTPISPMSTSASEPASGARMKVAISV